MKFKNKQLRSILEFNSGFSDVSSVNTSLSGHVLGTPRDMGFTPENQIKTNIRARKIVDATAGLLSSGGKLGRDLMLRNFPKSRRFFQTATKERSVLDLFKKPGNFPNTIITQRGNIPSSQTGQFSGTTRQLAGAIDTGIAVLGQYGIHKFKEGLKNVATDVLTKMADVRNEPRVTFSSKPFEFIDRKRAPITMEKEKLMTSLPGPSAYDMATTQGINVNRRRRSDVSLPGPSAYDMATTQGINVNRRRRSDDETKPGIYRPA